MAQREASELACARRKVPASVSASATGAPSEHSHSGRVKPAQGAMIKVEVVLQPRVPPAEAPPIGREPRRQYVCPWPASINGLPPGPGRGLPVARPRGGSRCWRRRRSPPSARRAESRGENDIVMACIGDDLLAAGDSYTWLRLCRAPPCPQLNSKSLPSGLKLKEPTTVPCLASTRKKRPSRPSHSRISPDPSPLAMVPSGATARLCTFSPWPVMRAISLPSATRQSLSS